jgi:hypothetical protein
MIEATLPLPPSTNNLFFTLKNGKRAKTTQYKDWQRIALAELAVAFVNAGRPAFDPKARMRLSVRVGASYRRDISNCIKPIEDLLVAALPLPDDRYNDVVEVSRDLSIEGFAHVRIGTL